MIKIFDKYIIGKFLSTFGFVLLGISLIACVIDFSEKVESFIKEPITKKEIFLDYYVNYIPHINTLLFPIYVLIAVIFFTSRLAYDSEIISVLNAGVSFQRFLRPFLLAASIVTSIHLLMNHFIVPNGNKKRIRIENKYIYKNNDKSKTDNIHFFLDPTTTLSIEYYRKSDTSARGMRIEKIVNGELKSVLYGMEAKWQPQKKAWKLTDYTRRSFDGLKETMFRSPIGAVMDTVINLSPEDLVRFSNQNEMLTTPELLAILKKQRERGVENTKKFEIEIARRTAAPFSIIIMTLIGVPLAARKVRGGMGLHIAMGMGLGAIFEFLSKFSVTFASSPSIPAFVAVWIPNVIFAGVAAYLIAKAQK